MVPIPLASLVKMDGKNSHKLWPREFAAFVLAIHNDATGRLSDLGDDIKETLEAIGEMATTTAKEQSPDQHPLPGRFDRTPLVAMGEWAKENDEPWLERACKFLIRHPDVRIVRDARSYGTYFKFDSMPKAWTGITSKNSVAELIFGLADEIEERLTGLED
jgi:hypothetical protein